jgi:hypothetical protein
MATNKDDVNVLTPVSVSQRSTTPPPAVVHAQHQRDAAGSRYPEYLDGDEMRHALLWSRLRRRCREPLAEFLGVMVMLMFGDGSVAQVVLSNGVKGQYQSISWGWG